METLYVDNFRGFSKTFLPLKAINFFVGENSTGKTSLLKLLGVFTSQNFWHFNQFGDEIGVMGEFSEMITSPRLPNHEYFEVAILGDQNAGNGFSAIKLKFVEVGNSPFWKELRLINSDKEIQIYTDGEFIKFRFRKIEVTQFKSDVDIQMLFKKWISENALLELPFRRSKVSILGITPLLNQLSNLLIKNGELHDNETISIPKFLENIARTAPVRSQPQRTYDSITLNFDSMGRHAPYVLHNFLINDKISKRILNRFGEDSGLYDDIIINKLSESPLTSNSFEILFKLDNRILNITNVGYGISQVLPLIIEVVARPENSWFAIQQPEIHLHPRAQAAFGDFIFKSNEIDRHKFIIETHSDFIIDRCRIRINKKSKNKNKNLNSCAQIVFFSRSSTGNTLTTIEIEKDGAYAEDQPAEFRTFFIREQLELINI